MTPTTLSAIPSPLRMQMAHALRLIARGGVIAYPTESVYGLGCNPFDAAAVARLREIKGRSRNRGFILIAGAVEQVRPLILHRGGIPWQDIVSRWPGPVTWVFDAGPAAPPWLLAEDRSIAVRVTAHPVAAALCLFAGAPLISTSANSRGQRPLRDGLSVRCKLGTAVDGILRDPSSNTGRPTVIMDARTGDCLRA